MIKQKKRKMVFRRIATLAPVMAVLTLFGCSHTEHPSRGEFKPVLLSEKVTNTIDLRGSGQASNLDKVYLVGYAKDEQPICSMFTQRVVDVEWKDNVATPKYAIDSEDVPCPPMEK